MKKFDRSIAFGSDGALSLSFDEEKDPNKVTVVISNTLALDPEGFKSRVCDAIMDCTGKLEKNDSNLSVNYHFEISSPLELKEFNSNPNSYVHLMYIRINYHLGLSDHAANNRAA